MFSIYIIHVLTSLYSITFHIYLNVKSAKYNIGKLKPYGVTNKTTLAKQTFKF